MNNGSDRLDRVEQILDKVAQSLRESTVRNQEAFERINRSLQEVAARQQYHDEAFERHDAEMKALREAMAVDTENIRALARIAEIRHRRLTDLEGGEEN